MFKILTAQQKPSEEVSEKKNRPYGLPNPADVIDTITIKDAEGKIIQQTSREEREKEYSEEYSQETAEQPSIDTPYHFDELISSEEEAEQEAQHVQVTSEMIETEAFHALFCTGFCTASYITGLKSLEVDKSDGAARACTQALYDTIIDTPALHFLLMPQNKWLERAIAIGMFTIPMAGAVSKEMKAKKAQKKPKQQETAAAPVMTGNLREMAAQQEDS